MKHNVRIVYSGSWVLAHQTDKKLPVERTADAIKEARGLAFAPVSLSLTELSFTLTSENPPAYEAKSLAKLIRGLYDFNAGDVESEREGAGGKTVVSLGEKAEICVEPSEETPIAPDALLADINALIGWESFKELCAELVAVAPEIKKHNTARAFLYRNYLFSVDNGCGLTTALNLFAVLVEKLGLFTFQGREKGGSGREKGFEMKLSARTGDGMFSPSDAIKTLCGEDEKGKLVCFDIGEFMEKSRHNDLKRFLEELVAFEEDYIFAFRVPFVEPDVLNNIYKVLSDVLFVRTVPVVPFCNRQLRECAERTLKTNGFTVEQMAWDVFFSRICEEKSDGRFYGCQSVNKIVYEMLWLKHVSDAAGNGSDVICREEIKKLSPSYSEKQKNGFDELSEMIGMEKTAERLREIVAQVKVSLGSERMERPCLHMRFTGAPGTGKTTVARIVGKIFAENGILRNGYFFEYTARDLCGEYVGQTAPKTSSICRDAYGSVLFIDEAYALYSGDDRNTDYGREALTTLVSEMENHRSDMVVVMAGYREDMDKLMEGNAGLRSRMPFMIEFPSYTRPQLFEIYMSMVEKHFDYDASLREAAEKYFNSLSGDYIGSKEFANGRFARNLYERTWSKAAVRTQLDGGKALVLCGDDLRAAASEKEFSEKLMLSSSIGFSAK